MQAGGVALMVFIGSVAYQPAQLPPNAPFASGAHPSAFHSGMILYFHNNQRRLSTSLPDQDEAGAPVPWTKRNRS